MSSYLDPQPFRDWYAEQEAKGFQGEEIARRFGLDSRTLRRWRRESTHIRCGELEDALMNSDLSLWDIYPELVEEVESGEGFCRACDERAATVEGRCVWCDTPIDQSKRNGPPPGFGCHLTDDQLLKLHRLHLEGGVSIRELGRRIQVVAGYRTPGAAEFGIRNGFKRLFLERVWRHPTSLRTLSRCREVKEDGSACDAFPVCGENYCWPHHPDNRERAAARMVRATDLRLGREVAA
jgi:hypothetical protein